MFEVIEDGLARFGGEFRTGDYNPPKYPVIIEKPLSRDSFSNINLKQDGFLFGFAFTFWFLHQLSQYRRKIFSTKVLSLLPNHPTKQFLPREMFKWSIPPLILAVSACTYQSRLRLKGDWENSDDVERWQLRLARREYWMKKLEEAKRTGEHLPYLDTPFKKWLADTFGPLRGQRAFQFKKKIEIDYYD